MIRIQQLKLPVGHTEKELWQKAAKQLKISEKQIDDIKIVKKSVDARKKPEIFYVYTIDVLAEQEQKILKKVYSKNIMSTKEEHYQFPQKGNRKLSHPPVIIGSGPAGLFCAYLLAQMGYAPVVIERGREVRKRKQDVALFWKENQLHPDSNVQFGEGGAGTFSDGKLNTLIKDVKGRSKMVLKTFVSFGAPEKIVYEAKPHIGTDILTDIVERMRKDIEQAGGRFLFETCLTGFEWEQGRILALLCRQKGQTLRIETEAAVLAIGHSARDTFQMLQDHGFYMEAKSFATGFRVEHPQKMIDENQYGKEAAGVLPAASYKVASNLPNHRGVYSFCMCPGGYVVNASSELGRLAVNGMSYSGRDGANANSAIIVTVTPSDFPGTGPLAGLKFQRELEEAAYQMGGGSIPQQLFGDFERKRISGSFGAFESCTKGDVQFAPLHELFSPEITDSFIRGMHQFSRYMKDFDRYDCILSGVESRTSSPVRILRNEVFESNKEGIYPCGEGAGYAGGIMSAAMDGLKVAEAIISKFYM